MLLTHLLIIKEAQALKFLLGIELNKVMGSFFCSASDLFAVQSVIAMKVMILSVGTHRGGFQETCYRWAKK